MADSEKQTVVSRPSQRTEVPDPEPEVERGPLDRAGTQWSRFAARLLDVLLRPQRFWRDVRREEIAIRELLFPHLVILIGVLAGAGFIGQLLGDAGFGSAVGQLVTSFVSWFAMVGVFAIVAGSIASAKGARLSMSDSMRYAAYGLTPLFVVGVFSAIPLPHVAPIAGLIAMPWAFYVLSAGVVPCLGISTERSAPIAGLMCGATLILWTIMPTLLPELVAAITK
ncbi:MAG: hypothetical protein ACI9WU_004372 [Myxococcota bacterium]|jgi:hypothetical protein